MNRPVGELPAQVVAGADALDMVDIEQPRVLLVDDDERNLLAVRSILDDLGEVVTARSGEEALRHLLKGEFAVILLDVYMPGMDGYETAQIIRGRDQTKRIPIVFLSAVRTGSPSAPGGWWGSGWTPSAPQGAAVRIGRGFFLSGDPGGGVSSNGP